MSIHSFYFTFNERIAIKLAAGVLLSQRFEQVFLYLSTLSFFSIYTLSSNEETLIKLFELTSIFKFDILNKM